MHETLNVLLFILLYVGYIVFGTLAVPWKMVKDYDPCNMNVSFKKFFVKFAIIYAIRVVVACIVCVMWTYLISLLF